MFAADSGHLLGSFIRFFCSLCFCIIAVARSRARRRLVETLKSRRATSAETAVAIEAKGAFEPPMLALLLRRGAVVEVAEQDAYYLDEEKYAEMRSRDNKIAAAAAALLVLLAVILFAYL
jgi:hypothetical protein